MRTLIFTAAVLTMAAGIAHAAPADPRAINACSGITPASDQTMCVSEIQKCYVFFRDNHQAPGANVSDAQNMKGCIEEIMEGDSGDPAPPPDATGAVAK